MKLRNYLWLLCSALWSWQAASKHSGNWVQKQLDQLLQWGGGGIRRNTAVSCEMGGGSGRGVHLEVGWETHCQGSVGDTLPRYMFFTRSSSLLAWFPGPILKLNCLHCPLSHIVMHLTFSLAWSSSDWGQGLMPRRGLRRKVTGGQLDVLGFSYRHSTYMLHCVCELCVAMVTIMFQSSNQNVFSWGSDFIQIHPSLFTSHSQ